MNVSLWPSKTPAGDDVSYINVTVEHGGVTSVIFKDLALYKDVDIQYQELDARVSGTNWSWDDDTDLSYITPDQFKIAFTGATGYGTQNQYIRNISVDLPFAPVTRDDTRSGLCYTCGQSSIVIFANDYGYETNLYYPGTPPMPSNEYLDFNSFRFRIYNSAIGGYEDAPNPFEYEDPNTGTFRYVNTGSNTSYVTFTPSETILNSGNATPIQASIGYNIMNTAENTITIGEEYRSNTSKITFKFEPTLKKKYLIINNDVRE